MAARARLLGIAALAFVEAYSPALQAEDAAADAPTVVWRNPLDEAAASPPEPRSKTSAAFSALLDRLASGSGGPFIPASPSIEPPPAPSAPEVVALAPPPRPAPAPAPQADRQLVAEVQRLLAQLGYDPGPIDGAIGPRTTRAVLAFQQSAGLPADGEISQTLREQLVVLGGPAALEPAAGPAALPALLPFTTDLPATPGFDCARASMLLEQLICSDPELTAADGLMSRIYFTLRRDLPSGPSADLLQQQRAWVRQRLEQCPLSQADLQTASRRAEARACVMAATSARAVELYDRWQGVIGQG